MRFKGVKRRKITSYIPQGEFTRDNQAIHIVSLEDIEAEYTLVLSRLQLSAHMRDLQEHGQCLHPTFVKIRNPAYS